MLQYFLVFKIYHSVQWNCLHGAITSLGFFGIFFKRGSLGSSKSIEITKSKRQKKKKSHFSQLIIKALNIWFFLYSDFWQHGYKQLVFSFFSSLLISLQRGKELIFSVFPDMNNSPIRWWENWHLKIQT